MTIPWYIWTDFWDKNLIQNLESFSYLSVYITAYIFSIKKSPFLGIVKLDKKLLLIKTSNKFIYIWMCRVQYFCDAVCWWPSWLTIFWTAFAFVKCCWVQTAESCQSWTRHLLRRCEFVDCIPYVIVCHSCLLFFNCLLLWTHDDYKTRFPNLFHTVFMTYNV